MRPWWAMRGRRHMANGAAEIFLPSWHLFLPAQDPSLPPPLYICPLEHFRILNSFLQTASSSKMCRPCMTCLQALLSLISRYDPLWSHWPFSAFQTAQFLPTSSLCKHAVCFFVFCLVWFSQHLSFWPQTHPSDLYFPGSLKYCSFVDIIIICKYVFVIIWLLSISPIWPLD